MVPRTRSSSRALAHRNESKAEGSTRTRPGHGKLCTKIRARESSPDSSFHGTSSDENENKDQRGYMLSKGKEVQPKEKSKKRKLVQASQSSKEKKRVRRGSSLDLTDFADPDDLMDSGDTYEKLEQKLAEQGVQDWKNWCASHDRTCKPGLQKLLVYLSTILIPNDVKLIRKLCKTRDPDAKFIPLVSAERSIRPIIEYWLDTEGDFSPQRRQVEAGATLAVENKALKEELRTVKAEYRQFQQRFRTARRVMMEHSSPSPSPAPEPAPEPERETKKDSKDSRPLRGSSTSQAKSTFEVIESGIAPRVVAATASAAPATTASIERSSRHFEEDVHRTRFSSSSSSSRVLPKSMTIESESNNSSEIRNPTTTPHSTIQTQQQQRGTILSASQPTDLGSPQAVPEAMTYPVMPLHTRTAPLHIPSRPSPAVRQQQQRRLRELEQNHLRKHQQQPPAQSTLQSSGYKGPQAAVPKEATSYPETPESPEPGPSTGVPCRTLEPQHQKPRHHHKERQKHKHKHRKQKQQQQQQPDLPMSQSGSVERRQPLPLVEVPPLMPNHPQPTPSEAAPPARAPHQQKQQQQHQQQPPRSCLLAPQTTNTSNSQPSPKTRTPPIVHNTIETAPPGSCPHPIRHQQQPFSSSHTGTLESRGTLPTAPTSPPRSTHRRGANSVYFLPQQYHHHLDYPNYKPPPAPAWAQNRNRDPRQMKRISYEDIPDIYADLSSLSRSPTPTGAVVTMLPPKPRHLYTKKDKKRRALYDSVMEKYRQQQKEEGSRLGQCRGESNFCAVGTLSGQYSQGSPLLMPKREQGYSKSISSLPPPPPPPPFSSPLPRAPAPPPPPPRADADDLEEDLPDRIMG